LQNMESLQELIGLIDAQITKEEQLEVLEKMLKNTKTRIMMLLHEMRSIEEIVLPQKIETKLGKLEIDNAKARLKKNVIDIKICLADLEIYETMINERK